MNSESESNKRRTERPDPGTTDVYIRKPGGGGDVQYRGYVCKHKRQWGECQICNPPK